jgi:hypothetical protein
MIFIVSTADGRVSPANAKWAECMENFIAKSYGVVLVKPK